MDTEESPTTEKVARDLELERVIYYWQFLPRHQRIKIALRVRYLAYMHRIEAYIQQLRVLITGRIKR